MYPQVLICSQKREEGYEDNCISLQEKEAMRKANLYPVCFDVRRSTPGTRLGSVCTCGCFDPSSELYTQDTQSEKSTWTNVVALSKNISRYRLFSLADKSSLSQADKEPRTINYYTHGEEHIPLYFIEVNGSTLGLTSKHGVLLANGHMTTAESLKVGDKLVSSEGKPVAIEKITQKTIDEEVINFLVKEEDENYNSHLIFAKGPQDTDEGVIVGDLVWQNNLAGELESITIRE